MLSTRVRLGVNLCSGLAVAAAISLCGPRAWAAPQVEFDIAPTLAVRELTTEAFSSTYPGERIWEARLHISSLIRHGGDGDLLQFFLRIESRGAGLKVVDYEPKTTMASNLAGNVGIQKHQERNKTLGLAVTGAFESVAKVTGNGSIGSRDVTDVRYELLAPRRLVASSGTIRRGAGAYFKLKPTRQSSLEGGKEYVVVFRAPESWRAGLLQVHCEALAIDRAFTPLLNEQVTRRQSFAVAVFAGGDREAKEAAEALTAAESQLRAAAVAHRGAIRKRAYPTPVHQFGAMLDLVDARIPPDWLQRLLAKPTAKSHLGLVRLPEEVRLAANDYVSAFKTVQRLSGKR